MSAKSVLSETDIEYAKAQRAQGVPLQAIAESLARKGVKITKQGLSQRLGSVDRGDAPTTSSALSDEMARLLRIAEDAEAHGKYRESTAASLAFAKLVAQSMAMTPVSETGHSTLQAWLSEIHEADVALRLGDPEGWARSQASEISVRLAELAQVCGGLPNGAEIIAMARGK